MRAVYKIFYVSAYYRLKMPSGNFYNFSQIHAKSESEFIYWIRNNTKRKI